MNKFVSYVCALVIPLLLLLLVEEGGVVMAAPNHQDNSSSEESKEMDLTIEALGKESHAEIAKGPHWDSDTQSLYYTNIYGPTLYRYDMKEDKVYKCSIPDEKISSTIIPIEGHSNQFTVTMGRFLKIVDWDGKTTECKVNRTLFEIEKDHPNNRFNDAKADPKGRFVGGTTHQEEDIFAKRESNLWRWESNGKPPIAIKENVGVSNGLTWNMNTKKFYYIDSVDFEIKEFDYEPESGNISNPKVLHDFRVDGKKPNFVPDSMAIDTDGNLYVALFGNHKVVKINATTGKIDQNIKLPAELITSCTFGGPNMDILFVTTASKGNKKEPAGQTFKVTGLGVHGVPTFKIKV